MELYMSSDNGTTWTKQTFNLFNLQDGQLYAGVNDTVYKVTKTADGKISSALYTEFVSAPPKQ